MKTYIVELVKRELERVEAAPNEKEASRCMNNTQWHEFTRYHFVVTGEKLKHWAYADESKPVPRIPDTVRLLRAEALSLDKAIAGNTPDDINKRLGVIVENSGQSTLRRELAMELRTRTGLGTMPPPHECVALLTLRTI
jgi:hypothetical protein